MMIDPKFSAGDSTSNGLMPLTADELATVTGGTTFELPFSWGIGITAAAVAGSLGAFAASGPGGLAFAAGFAGGTLLDAWADSRATNVRRSS